jgi:thiol-disulfide isomerase/thioredoxin
VRTERQRRPSRWWLGTAAVTLTLGLGLAGCSGSNSVDQTAGGGFGFVQQSIGKDFVAASHRRTAPALSGPTVSGGTLDLASLRGHIVVVNFWASWCSPCRAETPQLVALAKADPSISIVGVNEKDDTSAARAFIRDHQVGYPSIIDRIGTLAARWPVPPALPSTFVLDTSGRLAARFTGGVVESDLTPVIARLRAET